MFTRFTNLEFVPAGKRLTALISSCRSSSDQFLPPLPLPPADFSAFLDACRIRASASSFSFLICSFTSSIYRNTGKSESSEHLGTKARGSQPHANLIPTLHSIDETPRQACAFSLASLTPAPSCTAAQVTGQGLRSRQFEPLGTDLQGDWSVVLTFSTQASGLFSLELYPVCCSS